MNISLNGATHRAQAKSGVFGLYFDAEDFNLSTVLIAIHIQTIAQGPFKVLDIMGPGSVGVSGRCEKRSGEGQ